MARLGIITVLYNSGTALPTYLCSLSDQKFHDWTLVAVDNASVDRSGALVRGLHDARCQILDNAVNRGFAQAVNQGLRRLAAEGCDLFLLMNNDTAFAPDFLDGLLAARHRLDAGVLTPRIMRMDDPGEAWYAGGHLDEGWVFRNVHEPFDPAQDQAPRPVDFASGCCLLITRPVLERVGLLDERFFVYWEDTDFSLRLRQHGVTVMYDPGIVLRHVAGASSGGEFSPTYTRLFYRSYMQLIRKHFGRARAVRDAVRLISKELGRPGADRRQVRRMTLAILHGLAARPRPTAPLDAG